MHNPTPIEMHEITDAAELKKAQKQRAQFDQNSEWLQNNIADVYARHRGKFICVAGREVFAADTAADAIARATAAHPDDEGWFTRYIPKQKLARIYAL